MPWLPVSQRKLAVEVFFTSKEAIVAAFKYDFEGLTPQTPLTDLERNMSSVDTITGQTPRWKPDTLVQSSS